jgi:hypothetical protein
MVVAISGSWYKAQNTNVFAGAVYFDGKITRFKGTYQELVQTIGKRAGEQTVLTSDAALATALKVAGYKAEVVKRDPGLRRELRAYLNLPTYKKKLPLRVNDNQVA